MTVGVPPQSAEEISNAMRHRARVFRRARIVVLSLVVGYFFLPYGVRVYIPIWLPFLAALGLEVHFFVGGYVQTSRARPRTSRDPGPQPRDLADLGGSHWRDAHAVELEGEQHFVPTEGLEGDEETHERIAAYVEDPEATLAAVTAETAIPYEPPHASRRFVIEALVAIALVGGILYYASRPHGWDAVSTVHRAQAQAVYSREAAKIAGHPARVTCDTSGQYVGAVQEADGLAIVGGRQAYLTPSICNTLYQLAFKHRVQSFNGTARAIAVLAHESWHLHGIAAEGLVNCYAFQSGVGLGVDLGLSESKARSMMREQLATNAADSAGAPQYIVPSGCHNGGVFDLHPAASAFP